MKIEISKKRIITAILSAVLCIIPINRNYNLVNFSINYVNAESNSMSELSWTIENGILTVSGTGEMTTSSLNIPWSDQLDLIKGIVIEEGVVNIGSFAFRGCKNLESVKLPKSVQRIEKNAFKDCTLLSEIEFPTGLEMIERGAFANCTNLTEIIFPNTLLFIGESAFESCAFLGRVVIPDSVTQIDDYAFEDCSSNLLICCAFGSAAYSYAKANGINFDDSYSFEKTPGESDNPNNPDNPDDANTLYISTSYDMKKLADNGNIDKNITLLADITAPSEWQTINEFSGVFNGNGHSISGLSCSLFSTLGKDAVVKNLTLSDTVIEASDGKTQIGAIAVVNYGTIQNCEVLGEVSCRATLSFGSGSEISWISTTVFPESFSEFCTGGIAGVNYGTITGCINSANVSATNSSDLENDHSLYYVAAGGIAGENSGQIDHCISTGYVSASVSSYTVRTFGSSSEVSDRRGYSVAVGGGICGFSKGIITNCRSTGVSVTNSNYYAGKNFSSNASDEETASLISAEVIAYAGGIAGAISGSAISQCSVGTIEGKTGHSNVNLIVLGGKNVSDRLAYGYCGGIVGAAFNNASINECSNSVNPHISLTESGSLENIAYDRYCGGILGAAFYQDIQLNNCYNLGTPTQTIDINAGAMVTHMSGGFFHGGLIGAVRKSTIFSSKQFLNYYGSANVKNSYSISPSSSWKFDSGDDYKYDCALITEKDMFNSTSITDNAFFSNCYYLDTLTGKYGTAKSESGMKSKDFAAQLGSAFVYQEGDYPVLLWETENIRGDINADGRLTVADVILLQKWLLAVPDTKLTNWKAGDLCEDNRLDVFDLVLLKHELINKN